MQEQEPVDSELIGSEEDDDDGGNAFVERDEKTNTIDLEKTFVNLKDLLDDVYSLLYTCEEASSVIIDDLDKMSSRIDALEARCNQEPSKKKCKKRKEEVSASASASLEPPKLKRQTRM
jgi:hypothetical protein